MKNILILIFALMSLGVTTSKENDVKLIKLIYNLNDSAEKKKFDTWVKNNVYLLPSDSIGQRYQSKKELKAKATLSLPCVYEDDKYEVYTYCRGEFGGQILFLDKKTGKIHITRCTCYNMIIRQNNSYYVTESLAHMNGNLDVFEVKNPSLLPVIERKELKEKLPFYGWGKTPSDIATPKNILSESGYTALIFYPYKSKEYIIYSNYDTLFLGIVKEKRAVKIATLVTTKDNKHLFVSNSANVITNGIYESTLSQHSTYSSLDKNFDIHFKLDGKIYIKADTIVIGYSEREEKTKKE
jgi:hypothetical protein